MRMDKTLPAKYLLLALVGWLWLVLAGAAPLDTAQPNWLQAWLSGVWDQIDFNLIQGDRYKMIIEGLGVTLRVSLFAAVIGFTLGLVLALMRLSEARLGNWYPLKWLSGIYVDVIRGTPVVVQLFIMYYIVLITVTDKELVAVITFGLNSAATSSLSVTVISTI